MTAVDEKNDFSTLSENRTKIGRAARRRKCMSGKYGSGKIVSKGRYLEWRTVSSDHCYNCDFAISGSRFATLERSRRCFCSIRQWCSVESYNAGYTVMYMDCTFCVAPSVFIHCSLSPLWLSRILFFDDKKPTQLYETVLAKLRVARSLV